MKNRFFLYYVEGENEKKFVDTLKTKLCVIKPGKVHILNVIEERITSARLRTLSQGTTVVLIFDTDTNQTNILNENIRMLKACSAVSEVIIIPQVPNLEGELLRCCKIKKITDFLNSKSNGDFKRDFLRITNLESKLVEYRFDASQLWSTSPPAPYKHIENNANKVKTK